MKCIYEKLNTEKKRRIVLNGWRILGQERSAAEGKRVSFLKAKMREDGTHTVPLSIGYDERVSEIQIALH